MRIGSAVLLLALLACTPAAAGELSQAARARLLAAYPDQLERIDGNMLVWRDGTRMPLDDGKGAKTFAHWLDDPDIEDMLAVPYPAGDRRRRRPRTSTRGARATRRSSTRSTATAARARSRGTSPPSCGYPRRAASACPSARSTGPRGRCEAVSRRARRAAGPLRCFPLSLGRHLQLPPDRRHQARLRARARHRHRHRA